MRKFIPAFEFRRRARAAMLPVMSILVVVTLIAMLPSIVSSIVTTVADSDPSVMLADLYTEENLTAMVSDDPAVVASVTDRMMAKMSSFFAQKWPFMALTALVTMLLGPVLTLGFNHTLLKCLRKEEITYLTVLARLPIFFKAIGLNLMIFLRIFLWMLPGWALSLLGAVIMVFEANIGVLVMIAAMGVMLAGMIRAMYRYHLATYIMADAPETGINAAIRRSREIMKGRKMELFSLEVSFVGWHLAVSLAQMLLLTLLGSVLGMALGMFASFLLQLYVYMATASFYQEYGVGPLPEAAPEQEELL